MILGTGYAIVVRHQNVGRLDVAMDDAFLVCVLDGLADLNEKFQARRGAEVVFVAVIGDFDAAHQFHDEIRAAGFRRARVQHLGNVRMVHQGQRLPLRLEPGDDTLGVHAQLDDLERHPAANRFLLLGHINHAAAAFADLLQQVCSGQCGRRVSQRGFPENEWCRLNQAFPPRRKWAAPRMTVYQRSCRRHREPGAKLRLAGARRHRPHRLGPDMRRVDRRAIPTLRQIPQLRGWAVRSSQFDHLPFNTRNRSQKGEEFGGFELRSKVMTYADAVFENG